MAGVKSESGSWVSRKLGSDAVTGREAGKDRERLSFYGPSHRCYCGNWNQLASQPCCVILFCAVAYFLLSHCVDPSTSLSLFDQPLYLSDHLSGNLSLLHFFFSILGILPCPPRTYLMFLPFFFFFFCHSHEHTLCNLVWSSLLTSCCFHPSFFPL